MKINMSEELHFEDIPLDDGSEKKDELEKEAEKGEKETQKEIDKRIKDVETINKDASKKLNLKTGENKSYNPDKGNTSKVKELKEGTQLTLSEEDDLDEAIPSDLAKAYKKSRWKGRPNADLQNAEYTEVTPDEAYDIIKKQDKEASLRLIINGRTILINNGYGTRDDQFRTNVYDRPFVRRSGDKEYDTAKMSLKHLLSIADKIYATNESDPEGQKDPALLASRRSNPESKFYNGPDKPGSGRGSSWRSWNDISGKEADANTRRAYSDYRAKKDALKAKLDSGELTQDEYEQSMTLAKNELVRDLSRRLNSYWNKKDKNAWKRNKNSQDTISAGIYQYRELKDQIDNAQYRVDRVNSKINDFQQSGSQRSRSIRSDIRYYQDKIRDAMSELAQLEMRLENIDTEDAAELQGLQDQLNAETSKLTDYQDQINKLLRKTEDLDTAEFYNQIKKQGLVEDLNDILESMFPLGYAADTAVDVLKNNKKMIKEMLDME